MKSFSAREGLCLFLVFFAVLSGMAANNPRSDSLRALFTFLMLLLYGSSLGVIAADNKKLYRRVYFVQWVCVAAVSFVALVDRDIVLRVNDLIMLTIAIPSVAYGVIVTMRQRSMLTVAQCLVCFAPLLLLSFLVYQST